MVIYLKKSECGNIIIKSEADKIGGINEQEVIKEISSYLNDKESKEFQTFLNSDYAKKSRAETYKMVGETLNVAKNEGIEKNTACGMLFSNLLMVYNKKLFEWQEFTKTLSKK